MKRFIAFIALLSLAFASLQGGGLFPLTTLPATGWTNSGVTLAADGSMLFDGADYLTTADSSLFAYNNGQPASWDFMVKLSQLPPCDNKFVLTSQGSLSGLWMLVEIFNDTCRPDGMGMMLVIEENNHPRYAAMTSFDVGEWHYLSIRKGTGSTFSMYQNCNELTPDGDTPNLTNYTGAYQVGQFVNGGHRLKGYISYMDFQRVNVPCAMPNQATPTPSLTPTQTFTPAATFTATVTNTPTITTTPTPIMFTCPVGYHWTGIDARTVRCEKD